MARYSELPWSRWLALCLVLVSQAALAQSVLVFSFDGDRRDKLRNQVVSALQDAGEVKLVPVKSYELAAKKAGYKGERASTVSAIAKVAPRVGADLIVDGKVSKRTVTVRFLDASGAEIYKRSLPVKKGQLTKSNATKLARAIATAVGTVSPATATEDSREEAPSGSGKVLEIAPESKAEPDPAPETKPDTSEAVASADSNSESAFSTSSDSDFGDDLAAVSTTVGPNTITLHLGGMTTWRGYCARPGVGSCAEFDRFAEAERPAGVSVLFNTPVPYAGFAFGLDLFPLAKAGMEGLQGLGIIGHYSRGFSLTEVNRRGDTGSTEPTRVVSVDQGWNVAAAYRYYFPLFKDDRGPLPAFAGLRAGYASRSFAVDPAAAVGLTGSHRSYPQVGLDLSIPVVRQVRLEASGLYLVNPRAGKEELNEYGASVASSGFGLEAGLAGELFGPVGYELRFRMASFKDRYEGEGARWVEGGAAEETYSSVFWGITAGF